MAEQTSSEQSAIPLAERARRYLNAHVARSVFVYAGEGKPDAETVIVEAVLEGLGAKREVRDTAPIDKPPEIVERYVTPWGTEG